ncbi:alpha/beta hydrolase [uncultured Corynebacterium sp.]|uniref:alpha/beta hydrolase n=1 Tax=uncultured Corynebacterium sp. TaxID=159447 RepID=UPI002632ECAB|nr:alpha/beta hydrolase [uncultured Corynebacterium sp.]
MTNQTPNSDVVNLSSSNDEPQDNFIPVTTEEGKLQQLIEWLEEHVSAYSYLNEVVPLGASEDEIAKARASVNDRGARMPDAIIHGSMMVLGAAVNHSSPYLAYADGKIEVVDTAVQAGATGQTDTNAGNSHKIPVRVFIPEEATGAVVVAAHGGGFWMGDGVLRENAFGPNMAALAARSGAIVVDVDYRLAPEHHVSAAVEDIATVVGAVVEDSLQLQKLGAKPINEDNPVVLYGVSSGGHNVASAVEQISQNTPVALLLVSPALDLRGAPEAWLQVFFGTKDDSAREVSPGIHGPSRSLRVHVQSASRDTVVRPATEYLKKVEEAGGKTSQTEFLATHQIAVPKVQREQITDAARFILEVTHSSRELPEDPAGEYDKEAIDRQNEESWGRS